MQFSERYTIAYYDCNSFNRSGTPRMRIIIWWLLLFTLYSASCCRGVADATESIAGFLPLCCTTRTLSASLPQRQLAQTQQIGYGRHSSLLILNADRRGIPQEPRRKSVARKFPLNPKRDRKLNSPSIDEPFDYRDGDDDGIVQSHSSSYNDSVEWGPTDDYDVNNNNLQQGAGRYFDSDDRQQQATTGIQTKRASVAIGRSGGDALEEGDQIINSHFFSRKPISDPTFRIDNTKSSGIVDTSSSSPTTSAIANNNNIFDDFCRGVGITRPSKIQSLAWPILIQGKHAIVADQTGSGKTLAYLIPLLQRVLSTTGFVKKSKPGTPRILVLAPTAELADQIHAVCIRLSQFVRFSTLVITATGTYNTSIRDQIRMIQRQPVDIMISTPGRISTILRTRNSGLDLSELQAIVLDEVDILLIDDETFGAQLREVGAAAPVQRTQFVFVTATLPDTIVAAVQKEFPTVQQIRGPGLHRLVPTVKGRLIDVSVPAQYNRDPKYCFNIKGDYLLESLRQTRCQRTLVFCNTVDSCRQVENLLNRRDRKGQIYTVLSYHNAMTATARNENLSIFAHGGARGGGSSSTMDTNNNMDYILVCTDRASRGVDFDQSPVDHVILFDFPQDPAEYVRRVGRTARAGRTGTTTVFAYGWQLPIARNIMTMAGTTNQLDSASLTMTTRTNMDEEQDDDSDLRSVKKDRILDNRRRQKRDTVLRDDMIDGNIKVGKLWKEARE